MENYTTVSMRDTIPNHCIWMYKRQHYCEEADIDIYVIRQGDEAHVVLCGVYNCPVVLCGVYNCPVRMSSPPSPPPPKKMLNLNLDWREHKFLSVMYLETHLLEHTIRRKLNTADNITVLQ